MDPQQRLVMEACAELASACPFTQATAVAVGIGAVDYLDLTARQPLSLYFATGGATSVAAGRYAAWEGRGEDCCALGKLRCSFPGQGRRRRAVAALASRHFWYKCTGTHSTRIT